jgi:hypothetical protein
METIACFVARTRGPVVPFVEDWYPWAYAHHYLRTEIENMPLELGRVLSSVRVDDAVAIIHGWCAATGEDVDEAVHLLADAYLERWGMTPPEDIYPVDVDPDLDLETDLDPLYAEDYGAGEDVYATGDDDPYGDDAEDPTQVIPVVRYSTPDGAERVPAAKEEAQADDRKNGDRPAGDRINGDRVNGDRANGERPAKVDRPKTDRSKVDRPARTPRPVKQGDRQMMAEQILAADQALVSEHPLVTGRSLAARR